jgi:probable HAF family extracellular repeat protein
MKSFTRQHKAGAGRMKLFVSHHPALLRIAGMLVLLSAARAATFRGLGDLPGGTFMSVGQAISADGRVAVGYSSSSNGTEAAYWRAETGWVGIGDLPGGTFSSFANAVSRDGSVIVGSGRSASGSEAFRWTKATGMSGLGDLAGGTFGSTAYGVSGGGEVIVGIAQSALSGTRPEAFRRTATNGMLGLGDLPGGNSASTAYAVSEDGKVIVGYSSSSNATAGASEAFRWTRESGMLALGDFPGGNFSSIAYGISGDGAVAVGRGYSGAVDLNTHEAFRWTAETGLVRLGFIPCSDWSIAHAASFDGSVIVGDPESNRGDCAFIWDARHGMRNLHEVLTNEYGLNVTGWQLSGARGISADGAVMVGYGTNPSGQTEGWIADLRPSIGITRRDAAVVVSWKTNGPATVLEQTEGFGIGPGWTTSSVPAYVVGEDFVVTNSTSAG